jgi:TetR/AcrR family transcriptional regulator, acrAB operon repressor
MARKTKEEAQETRSAILEAAVRTSLADIAAGGRRHPRRHLLAFRQQGRLAQHPVGPGAAALHPPGQASESRDEPDPLGKMKACI